MCGLVLVSVHVHTLCAFVLSKEIQHYIEAYNCVIGLSQPRYVMLNLVAKSTRRKGKNYKLL